MRLQNLTQRRFGKLIALSLSSPAADGRARWNVLCDCGQQKIVRHAALIKSDGTRSCGCTARQKSSERLKSRKLKIPENTCAFSELYGRYRRHAANASRTFDLKRDQFIALVTSTCHYCSAFPSIRVFSEKKATARFIRGNPLVNGLDRKDNSRGYTIDNVVTCCKTCNLGKHTSTYEEFLSYLDRLVAFRKHP